MLLFFAFLGGLQAFNTSNIRFLNPETSGETLAFIGLTVVLFLLLLVLLLLLLRNILKLSADQSNSALGARLRTRMVLGAALIAVTPAIFMFLFSFQLMNRTIDRWFSPNTSQLRDDSTRVVLELAQYVASNARSEAASIAATGAPDRRCRQTLQKVLASHRVTLQGGFVVIYAGGHHVLTTFEAPPETTSAASFHGSLRKPTIQNFNPPIPLRGSLSKNLLDSAQRNDEPVVRIAGQDYALGMLNIIRKAVVAALPMPQGLSQTTARIRQGATEYWAPVPLPQQPPRHFLPHAAADYGRGLLLQCLARALSFQTNYAPGRRAG